MAKKLAPLSGASAAHCLNRFRLPNLDKEYPYVANFQHGLYSKETGHISFQSSNEKDQILEFEQEELTLGVSSPIKQTDPVMQNNDVSVNPVSTQQNQSVTELVNISIGQRVQSAKFGIGIVIGKKGNGADEQVHVDFDGMGKKWLSLEFAKLKQVREGHSRYSAE